MAKMFISGELVDAVSGATYEVRNPANGEVVDTAPKGNEEDARRAIDAAEAAFDEWSHTSAEDRGKLLFKAAELVVAERKGLAELLCREQGKPFQEASGDSNIDHAALKRVARKLRGAQVPLPAKDATHGITRRSGVRSDRPWNCRPLLGTKVGPALRRQP